ncbi:MAG TPA: CHASE2 domain-containing protein, partial [Solirubrobacteraceae bacterium]
PKSEIPKGGAWIDYRGGPGTFPSYSFSDVLKGRVPASAFHNKIVVLGASARSACSPPGCSPACSTSSPRSWPSTPG